MSSNQLRNNKAEYLCEKKANESALHYMINKTYSEQKNPCHMFVLGSIPTKMSASHFTKSLIDV